MRCKSKRRCHKSWLKRLGAAALLILSAGWLWWRKNPSPCPYGQRLAVELPHPFITRKRLLEILAPQPGEKMLEIGPGTGYYTIPVAKALSPQGTLEILDIQQKMLDHTMNSVARAQLTNVDATVGDAANLPHPDSTFDAIFLVTVLGEVPNSSAALAQCYRVLKAGGRLVVGEVIGDPHMVRQKTLQNLAAENNFVFERKIGGVLGYFGLLKKS